MLHCSFPQEFLKPHIPSHWKFIRFTGDSITVQDYSRVDPIVRLISVIFRLANLEKLALSAGLSEHLSPQVGRTIVWCLRHWAKSYLLPDEKEYDQLSVTLMSVFGTGTEGGKWTLGFLLDKVRTNLSGWCAESQIIEDAAMLLLSLVDNKNRCTCYYIVFCFFSPTELLRSFKLVLLWF